MTANMAEGGLRGLLKNEFPWIFVFWCLAHRLELDALKSTSFSTIDDLLLRMYYIYEKSPKECRALEDVIAELKSYLELSEKGGSRPLRACGTRFVAHKVAALERVVERFGAYLTHLISMTEDEPADRQKMKGYVKTLRYCLAVLFFGIYSSLQLFCARFCRRTKFVSLGLLNLSVRPRNLLRSLKPRRASYYQKGNVHEEDGSVTYQGVDIKKHDQSITHLPLNGLRLWRLALEVISGEADLLTHAVTLLATNGWERTESDMKLSIQSVKNLAFP